MYNKIKSEISEKYYLDNFPNDGQRFVAWYLRNIHRRDVNETKAEITDGPNDKQIDAIFVDEQNCTVYVIQGKFIDHRTVDSEPLREVLASWIQLRDLVRLQETANLKLKQKLPDVAMALEDGYEISFELITTGQLTNSAKDDLITFQSKLAETDEFTASLTLIDTEELIRRFELALDKENPSINHSINLPAGKFINMEIGGTRAVVAALPLEECIKIPGIKNGTLFQKNVRQSLGLNNAVNKGIKSTIYSNSREFFFSHNGITALCNELFINDNTLNVRGLSVVNGCQSLTTLYSCSEKVKTQTDGYVLFRFYEIPDRKRADTISISTNSQSAVKARDLRSNDKRILNLKRSYEQKFQNGYLITKRGEIAPADKDRDLVVDIALLGKLLLSWHSQRPNIAYSENKLFDKYFDQIFKKDYLPENIQALNFWMAHVQRRWTKENPLGLNESLLAMKAYAPYHHLYAISLCFCISNKIPEGAPSPLLTMKRAVSNNIADQISDIAGSCLNSALEAAANEPQQGNRVFSPQNWIKTKSCLAGIRAAINQYYSMLPTMPNGRDIHRKMQDSMKMESEEFEARWAAD